MKKRNQVKAADPTGKLRPYRKKIDAIDDKIMKLLRDRFGVIRRVARIKHANDIPAVLQDRVDEVRNRNVAAAGKYGIDKEFARALYTMIIYQSCDTEENIKRDLTKAQKKKKKA